MKKSIFLKETINRIVLQELNNILFEGIVDDVKIKYPQFEKEIDELVKNDPSGKNKYLRWSVKQLEKNHSLNDIIPTIDYFHKKNQKFKQKDINQYKDLKDLENVVKDLSAKPTKSDLKGKSEKIYENDNFVIVHPIDKDATICYGRGTKWCITMSDANYFEDYSGDNVVFYFVINKNLPPDNPLHKVAYAVMREKDNSIKGIEIYDAEDNKIDSPEEYLKFLNLIKKDARNRDQTFHYKMNNDLLTNEELLKLINDKDPGIRHSIVGKINPKYLPQMMNDKDPGIRFNVAQKIDSKYLPQMMNDKNLSIRRVVAQRIDPKYLPQMMKDKNRGVRYNVAQRIDPKYLPRMMNDVNEKVRLSIAQKIDPKYLPQMMNDEDSVIRLNVAKRIDPKYLPQMMDDKHSFIREVVAKRINPKHLPQMMNDKHLNVRTIVTSKIDLKYLPQMMNDEDSVIRLNVAKRIDPKYLPQMMDDKDWSVRTAVANRIDQAYLPKMMNDENWSVRKFVAKRINPKHLPQMMNDEYQAVRSVVIDRMKSLGMM